MKENRSVTIPVKITPTLKKELDKIASEKDRGVSYIVNQVLESKFLNGKKGKSK